MKQGGRHEGGEGKVQVAERLPSKHEALSSNTNTVKKKKKRKTH
jgi:hypothetical protein